jgi:hypothetical protein
MGIRGFSTYILHKNTLVTVVSPYVYPAGNAGDGFNGDLQIAPTFRFYGLGHFREGACPAVANGWFAPIATPHQQGGVLNVNVSNGGIHDYIGVNIPGYAPDPAHPFAQGTWTWNIPHSFPPTSEKAGDQ